MGNVSAAYEACDGQTGGLDKVKLRPSNGHGCESIMSSGNNILEVLVTGYGGRCLPALPRSVI